MMKRSVSPNMRSNGMPAQEQANILEVAVDGGDGEIGALKSGAECRQPRWVGDRRRRRYFPQCHPLG